LTDLRVYDWWDLIQDWGAEVQQRVAEKDGKDAAEALKYTKWVGALMLEGGVRSLPRCAGGIRKGLGLKSVLGGDWRLAASGTG
jgi:hypothetical protein